MQLQFHCFSKGGVTCCGIYSPVRGANSPCRRPQYAAVRLHPRLFLYIACGRFVGAKPDIAFRLDVFDQAFQRDDP